MKKIIILCIFTFCSLTIFAEENFKFVSNIDTQHIYPAKQIKSTFTVVDDLNIVRIDSVNDCTYNVKTMNSKGKMMYHDTKTARYTDEFMTDRGVIYNSCMKSYRTKQEVIQYCSNFSCAKLVYRGFLLKPRKVKVTRIKYEDNDRVIENRCLKTQLSELSRIVDNEVIKDFAKKYGLNLHVLLNSYYGPALRNTDREYGVKLQNGNLTVMAGFSFFPRECKIVKAEELERIIMSLDLNESGVQVTDNNLKEVLNDIQNQINKRPLKQ